MTDATEALLPCPFCGSPAMAVRSTNTDWYGHWLVACNAPDDTCPVDPYLYGGMGGDDDRAKVVARWNRRALLAGHDETVERCAREVEDCAKDPEVQGSAAQEALAFVAFRLRALRTKP